MAAAPGWYPDTTMTGTQRYWDGERWTDHVAPLTTPAPSTGAQAPRRRPDGSLKGPSLVTALGTLGLGILLVIASLVVVVPAFIDSIDGTRWQVPGTNREHLDTGGWVLYERVGFGGFGRIGPSDVSIAGPAPIVPRRDLSNQTITINGREYVGVVRFDVESSGTYDITVRGEPSVVGEVLLSRPIWDFFNRWPWFLVGAVGAVLSVLGTVLWIVGGINRGRARRFGAQSAAPGPR